MGIEDFAQRRARSGSRFGRALRRETTHIYVCRLREMDAGVEAAFEDICHAHSLSWQERRARLRDEGRFDVKTY